VIHGANNATVGNHRRMTCIPKTLLIPLVMFLYLQAARTEAACLTSDELYEIGNGDQPREFMWKGAHYSSVCECSGNTAGISGGAYACIIGETCRCGTFNGKPWMGAVVHQSSNSVVDFGSNGKAFVRGDRFFLFFAEVKLLKDKMRCSSERSEEEVSYECEIGDGSRITLSSGDFRSLKSVTLYWKGELAPEVASKFVELYGAPDSALLAQELARDTPRAGRRNHQFQLGRHDVSHSFDRPNVDSPAEHWVTIE
jgi:hypothetical protein